MASPPTDDEGWILQGAVRRYRAEGECDTDTGGDSAPDDAASGTRPWEDGEGHVLRRCDGVFEDANGADVDHLVVRRLRRSRGKPVLAGGDNSTGFPFEMPLDVSREVVVDTTDPF